ncbi:hypothetical protein [Amycolatopsis sp. cg9]|uniref:hypothetical protein n=1 Tax=Amycolatopsis sp. cg9 TaxID=3238801 RepID=UPI003526B268
MRLEKGTTDRRSLNVVLTEEGRHRFEQALVLWRSAQDRVVAALGASVADRLRDQLNAIAEDDQLRSQP